MAATMNSQVISNKAIYKGAIPNIQTNIRIQKLVDRSIQAEFKNIYRAYRHRLQSGMASRSMRRADRLLYMDSSPDTHIRLQPCYTRSNRKFYNIANCPTNPDTIHIDFDHNHIRGQLLDGHLYRSNQQDRYLYRRFIMSLRQFQGCETVIQEMNRTRI